MNDLENKTESELQELLDKTARILTGSGYIDYLAGGRSSVKQRPYFHWATAT